MVVVGLKVYRGAPFQKGYGIGSLFHSVFPLIKQCAKTVGQELSRWGVNLEAVRE